ncbi:UDP-glucose/GDP-mannose dehydrogenase family protein [Candidatus Parcubacteria bacterium]|nr:UDP-glucose/GDP-mannose dehydrogenase family protein [Patescibacteria group bacterium]MCG2689204.1 UDP-glucose/GDP-mannose dehydrogenase family protein [Candidatus Parcubacteria bacterium]
MKISVIGTGYVGLVTGVVFADWGHSITCADINKEKIKMLHKGVMPIYEEGLQELVEKNVQEGRLLFTHDVAEAIRNTEVVIIAVGTPSSQSGSADLSAVWSVAKTIGENLNNYKIIVTKSTVPVGTNERVEEIVGKNAPKDAKFSVVSNPEFLREGTAIYDANNTDRVVMGSKDTKALDKIASLYSHLNAPIVKCDLRSAELIKYASNAFLATKISFINEIARICNSAGANVKVVAEGMGLDKRVGRAFLNAGIGYGGSCFPKDVEALYRTSSDHEYDFRLLRGVMDVNERQKYFYLEQILTHFKGNIAGKTFACLGLAFKNNTDDTRKSVAIEIVKMLRGEGALLRVFDPAAMENAEKILGNGVVYYAKSAADALKGSDALCILTEWQEFAELDLGKVKGALTGDVIFDGRNLFDPKKVKKAGLKYYGIGRR